MRYIILLLFCFSAPLLLIAQDKQQTPRVEIFGGYSFVHQTLGDSSNANGWEVSATYQVNRWLGTTADYSGNYYRNSASGVIVPPSTTPFDLRVRENHYHALFGPQVSLHTSRFQPFAHALFGFRRETVAFDVGPGAPIPSNSLTENFFTTALGGGIDVAVSHRIAVRLAQADYLLTPNGGVTKNSFRYSAGIVFHLGGVK